MRRTIDLHIHTTASDGSYSPQEVVSFAKKIGLAAIAITDHDNTDGVDEAVTASKKYNVEVVPGVEISIGEEDSMHIVGLYVDHNNPALISKLDFLKQKRRERNVKLIENLQKEGFNVTVEAVAEYSGSANIGRLHVAQYLQSIGVVNDYRKIFRQYIMEKGSAYVRREKLGEREGIETILSAGGVPVLAHINYFRKEREDMEIIIKRLKNYGLGGIETMYTAYNAETATTADYLAEKYDLLKSGGSDFHGARRIGVELGKGRGNLSVPYEFLEKIKKR